MSNSFLVALESAAAHSLTNRLNDMWRKALEAAEVAARPELNKDADEINVATYMRNWNMAQVRLRDCHEHIDRTDSTDSSAIL